MDIQIEKKNVALHFGLDFMDEINALSGLDVNGVNIGAGAVTEQQKLEIGDPTALARVIYAASKGSSPRPSLDMVKQHVEAIHDEAELQGLFDEALEAIKNSFPLQFQLKKMQKTAKEAERKAGAINATK